MMPDYYGLAAILSSIVNKISDSQRLTMHHKPSSHPQAGYNIANELQCQLESLINFEHSIFHTEREPN